MIKKLAATAALTAGLSLGVGGIASAATTSNAATPAHAINCANVAKIDARIAKIEAKANAWLPKAQARLVKAQKNNHPVVAARIQRRITWVDKILNTRIPAVEAKVAAQCPGTPAS